MANEFMAVLESDEEWYVALNFLDSYDSRPPTEDAVKNDFSFTTSLGYTF